MADRWPGSNWRFWSNAFLIVPNAPVITDNIFVLAFHILLTAISGSLYLLSFSVSFVLTFESCGMAISISKQIFSPLLLLLLLRSFYRFCIQQFAEQQHLTRSGYKLCCSRHTPLQLSLVLPHRLPCIASMQTACRRRYVHWATCRRLATFLWSPFTHTCMQQKLIYLVSPGERICRVIPLFPSGPKWPVVGCALRLSLCRLPEISG